mmetsp:Transcript_32553/g.46270  ORF Transcript_32553/g.46270 Transcript_32553/m.46270 type:complete len:80 (+) Transcript_32553:1301-1540(+)
MVQESGILSPTLWHDENAHRHFGSISLWKNVSHDEQHRRKKVEIYKSHTPTKQKQKVEKIIYMFLERKSHTSPKSFDLS